jgi:autotransporter-associated beta strand protein
MRPSSLSRRNNQRKIGLLMAATAACTAGYAGAQVTLTKNSNTNWTITNGALTAVFDPQGEEITSIKLGVGSGAGEDLLNPGGGTDGSLNQEFAGTPFGSGPQTFNDVVGPNNSYVDVWTQVASEGTTTNGSGTYINPITYSFHYVLFANDPTVYVYEALSHAATDPATSVGQGQFLFRSNPSIFPNLYQINTGPNQLGTAYAQTTVGVPSTNPLFNTVTGTAARTVQNVTYDLTNSGITDTFNGVPGVGDNGTNFFTKYDYSTYTQFYQAETMYGSQYAVTEVVPSTETMTGGPTKQELAWTDPGILNMEFLSDHYGIDGSGSGAYPGYAYYPTVGVASTDLFGPFAFTVSSTASTTAPQINQNAINSIPSDIAEFNTDTELAASGYVGYGPRGSMQINAANSAGWSTNTANNTIVLSEPGVNFQESTQGDQYWAQISQNGTATISNAAPGTYRLTMYELGQWGETRIDGVQVKAGQVTIPQSLTFTPENFGTSAPIWTIGTPNRSSNEFMNGHMSDGADLRQYYGAYNYWAEEQALGTPGYVSYYATAVGSTPATNNPNDWIANQWQTFDPPLYDASNNSTDNYNNEVPSYVTAAGGPASYHGSPWQVHFTVTPAQLAQGQYVVLSVGLVALDASLVVSLNGVSETWSYNNFSPDDPMVRSGDAGFYQWAAFQFPTSDLNAAGVGDEFTFGLSNHTDGVMYDALRMEITNTSAAPSTTGWHDYTYINGGSQTAPNDALGGSITQAFTPQPVSWDNYQGGGNGTTWDTTNLNWNDGTEPALYYTGAAVTFNDNNNGNYNVTLSSVVTPSSVTVSNSAGNYVFSGAGGIGGTSSLTKTGSSTLTLNTVNTYSGGTTILGGTLVVGVSGALSTNGPVTVGNSSSSATLQLAAGLGTVTMPASILSISSGSTLDLTNNELLLTYSSADPIGLIQSYLTDGYNGNWASGEITSSTVVAANNAQSNLIYSIGYADGADGLVPGLNSGQIEVLPTLAGDAMLQGNVVFGDFQLLSEYFGQSGTWDEGNFRYQSTINFGDFELLAQNFNSTSTGLTAAELASMSSFAADFGYELVPNAGGGFQIVSVPEPAAISLLLLGSACLAARRRSRQ